MEDLPTFDSRVSPVKEEAIHAVVQFIEMNNVDQSPLGEAHPDGESSLRKRHTENSDFEGESLIREKTAAFIKSAFLYSKCIILHFKD